MPLLEPQAALETAVVNAVLAGGLGYLAPQVVRTFDGRPPPSCGPIFLAVWSGGGRRRGNSSDGLDQYFGVNVTLTLRTVQPFDRSIRHRDDVENRLNDVVALVHQDRYAHSIILAANAMAGYRQASVVDPTKHVGFCQALGWAGTDDCREVGGEWFLSQSAKHAGVTQTAHFDGARRTQYALTAQ